MDAFRGARHVKPSVTGRWRDVLMEHHHVAAGAHAAVEAGEQGQIDPDEIRTRTGVSAVVVQKHDVLPGPDRVEPIDPAPEALSVLLGGDGVVVGELGAFGDVLMLTDRV